MMAIVDLLCVTISWANGDISSNDISDQLVYMPFRPFRSFRSALLEETVKIQTMQVILQEEY